MSAERTAEAPKPFAERVASTLIEQLKAGTAPWQRPWEDGPWLLPVNPVTGKRYRGVNVVSLMLAGRSDPRWMTYRQAQSVGAQVRQGERSSSVQYWKFHEERPELDAAGTPVINAEGNVVRHHVALERPKVFFAAVFNAEQLDGLPPLEQQAPSWDPVERAEQIVRSSGAVIAHGGNRACYSATTDRIQLPNRGQFPDSARYYATALHELGHWTGHASRLERDLGHPFGSEGYAREELRAEIASMLLGAELGLGHDPGQHAAYVSNWIKVLADDPSEIVRAASDAEKIHEYVLGLERQLVRGSEPERHAAALEQLQRAHEEAVAGYSSLETWRNLQATAAALGLQATLSTGAAAPWPQAVVHYATAEGLTLPVRTLLSVADGKALTVVGGVRVEGTHFSPDAEAQQFALRTAVATAGRGSAQPVGAQHSNGKEAVATIDNPETRTYIAVPYKERHEARSAGARWDRAAQCWYFAAGLQPDRFAKWPTTEVRGNEGRLYLAVPYADRHQAKAEGARWDTGAKSWYVDATADRKAIERWLPSAVTEQAQPAPSPREEFAQALRDMGCVVAGEHPIMDGKAHRLRVEGDKRGQTGGFYVAHLDNLPAGFIENHRTGQKTTWKSKGYELDQETIAKLRSAAAQKLQDRAAERAEREQATAERLSRELSSLPAVTEQTPYLQLKGVSVQPGLRTDGKGTTIVPVTDANGALRTVQYVDAEGTKRFAKGGRKAGCFHVVGGFERLTGAKALVIAEGYATAATVSELLGQPAVAALDAGNLVAVAKALHEKYPDKPIVVVGDDDRGQQQKSGANPGRSKAVAAAEAVSGTVLLPIFAPGEQDSAPRQFSDFNDLATRSVLGREGARGQAQHAWERALQRGAQSQANARRKPAKLDQSTVADRPARRAVR